MGREDSENVFNFGLENFDLMELGLSSSYLKEVKRSSLTLLLSD
jgi:hypothetical protein